MNTTNKLIHHEKLFKLKNLLPMILMIVVWGFFFWFNWENPFLLVVFIGISLIALIAAIRRNSTYSIYEDRIELLNFSAKKSIETITFDQIDQIRFEDEFDDSYGALFSKYIIIYPRQGVVWKNQKNGRIALTVTGIKRKSTILKLLKFFQSKDLEVVIKTDSKKILQETGLKNWDQA